MTVPTLIGTLVSSANATSHTSTAATAGAGVGQLVTVAVTTGGAANPPTAVTDSAGNTYSLVPGTTASAASGTPVTTSLWQAVLGSAIVSGTTTWTAVKATSGGTAAVVLAMPAGWSATPYDADIGSNVSATTPFATAAVDVLAGHTVLCLAGSAANKTYAGAQTWGTVIGTATDTGTGAPRTAAVTYLEVTSAGSQTPSVTPNSGNAYAASAVVMQQIASVSTTRSTTWRVGGPVQASRTTTWNVAVPRPTVALIGDSTSERQGNAAAPPDRKADTTAAMVAAGVVPGAGSFGWYAKGGKPFGGSPNTDANGKTVAQNIADHRAALGKVDKWIIGLGTNDVSETDTQFTDGITAVLNTIYSDASHSDETVYWVNLAYFSGNNTNAVHFNPLLQATLAGYSTGGTGTIRYLDWNTYSHSAGVYDAADWNGSGDAAHMSSTGWPKRDAWIASQVAIVGSVTATRPTSYGVASTTGAARAASWAARAFTGAAARAVSWGVGGAVATGKATTWGVGGAAATSRTSSWNTNLRRNTSRATSWATIGYATAARAAGWNVAAQTSAARAASYSVRTVAAAATQATSWNTAATVLAGRATTWGIAGRVTAARAALYNVALQVAAARTARWDTTTTATASPRTARWNVLETLAAVGRAIATSWTTRSGVAPPMTATLWDSYQRVSRTRAASWATGLSIGALRTTAWDVMRPTIAAAFHRPVITAPPNSVEVEVTNMGGSPKMYQGDLLPDLQLTAVDYAVVDGTEVQVPLSLTPFTTVTITATRNGKPVFTRAPYSVNGPVAVMKWQPGDTDTLGVLRFHLEITDDEGRQRTIPMRRGFPVVSRTR